MHISIGKDNVQGYFLKDSEIMVEQITILDKKSIISKYGYVKPEFMTEVDEILYKHLGLAAPLEHDQEDDKAGDPS